MNKKALVCIASFPLFAIGTLFATTTGEADWLVPNGGEGWPVVFEDNNLNQREKKAIFADYFALCKQFAPTGSYDAVSRNNSPCRWMGRDENAYVMIPDAAYNHIGLLRVEKDGREVAVIDCALSDAYKKALAHQELHRNAYACLPAFVGIMNNLREEDLPDTLAEILYVAQDARHYADEIGNVTTKQFVDVYGNCRYELSSILDWGEFEGLPMASLRMFANGEKNRFQPFFVVFEGGRWKVLVHAGMFV